LPIFILTIELRMINIMLNSFLEASYKSTAKPNNLLVTVAVGTNWFDTFINARVYACRHFYSL
jgi:hypothetical protein